MRPRPEECTPLSDELSDEQFCELLLRGGVDSAPEETRFRNALAGYRKESLLWAERRSAAMPSLLPAARRSSVWAAVPQWALAAVAAVTVAVGITYVHSSSQLGAATEASTILTRTNAEQIADDNALLNQIDAAVNAGSELQVDALGLHTGRDQSDRHGSTE